ncbi:hypothetical protein PIB30_100481, partial [Stylosanthes scabra]|nr:hypothetical protein [Stylosanthes scabra]
GEHTSVKEGERKGRWFEENTFMEFADNLQVDATEHWLWKVFNSTGKVMDVYLSRKMRHYKKYARYRRNYRRILWRTLPADLGGELPADLEQISSPIKFTGGL